MTWTTKNDIETGCYGKECVGGRALSWLSRVCTWIRQAQPQRKDAMNKRSRQIEDFPIGYPRFAALIASHHSLHLCRRFSNLRTRLLLLKQDRLCVLERRLEKIDRDEISHLPLASFRRDGNEQRHALLDEIDDKLGDYDQFLDRHRRMLQLEPASDRAAENLINWIRANGCIARDEIDYITESWDLASVASPEDGTIAYLEEFVERCCISMQRILRKIHMGNSSTWTTQGLGSRDPKVHIFSAPLLYRRARILLAPLVTTLLLTPVVICNFLASLSSRLAVVVFATSVFVAVLSVLTRAKTIDLIVAGATYTTVLVVFISSNEPAAN